MKSIAQSGEVLARAEKLADRFGNEAYYLGCCFRSGMFGIEPPHRLARVVKAFGDYGMLGAGVAAAAIRHPDQLALIDEQGELTYRQLDDRVNAVATAWIGAGLKAGDGVAIMTRNHRGFLEALFAAARCGARVILMNTGFSGPQVREVSEREGVDLFVYDEEFEPLIGDLALPRGRFRAWLETRHDADDTLAALIASTPTRTPPKPARAPRLVILTSGTTGTPKGAGRDVPFSLSPVGGPLSKVPFRSGDVAQISAPLFHALGFTQGLLQIGLGATLVLQRRFVPADALDSLARHRVTTWVVVPVMLQRVLELELEDRQGRDLSHLRIIYLSGSQLGTDLARRAHTAFGPVLYNLYGSTEIAYATIATPADLDAAPASVGRVVRGAVVKILGTDGEELPPGETGRIFVGHMIQFEGYTGGGDKERIRGLISSGDVGHFDAAGRLFIDGRDDEMIISGGENVFPREIEELLHLHPAVLEAAAAGVPDEKFGQRLSVFVVLRDGAELTAEDVKEYVRDNLARYKVPREVVFLDELPRNPTGKVLKRELFNR
ncbi:MAG TPA: acyl-CoA synthetase [Solirubrobacteraceae bacterium]|jgi:fatty-acyl-CoA synthase|nr:acyl-CoA synthetase [Solirubrobacteraceae bacterium]